jgi:hypothetical protein
MAGFGVVDGDEEGGRRDEGNVTTAITEARSIPNRVASDLRRRLLILKMILRDISF